MLTLPADTLPVVIGKIQLCHALVAATKPPFVLQLFGVNSCVVLDVVKVLL